MYTKEGNDELFYVEPFNMLKRVRGCSVGSTL